MAVRFPEPIHLVDPVELEINQLFDHLIMCLNQRRVVLLTTYRDTRAQIADIPIARARKEAELIGLKTETESRIRMNELRGIQERILAKIEQKLDEVRVPQPETHAVFRGNWRHLEQVIVGVGEVVEEEVPAIPQKVPVVASNKPTVPHDVPVVASNKPTVPQDVPDVASNKPDVPQVELVVASNKPTVPQDVPVVASNKPTVPQDVPVVASNMPDLPQEEVKSKNVSDTPKKVPDVQLKVRDVFKKVSVVLRYEQMIPIVAIGKNGYAPGELWNPWGVAFDENSNLINVADGFNSFRISIFSDSGEIMNTFTHQGMKEPWGIAIHRDNL